MSHYMKLIVFLALAFSLGIVSLALCADCSPARRCVPDCPVPPESIGCMSLPFDIPIWPTMIKTEFHILPWVSLSKFSVCLPGRCQALEFRFPCLSLKPVPVWFPWLKPLDAECKNSEAYPVP
ncbi:MAG: hypothetical protein ACLPVO_01295 [Desulfomonilaceae bacterium]